ncbi:MAG: U3 small nucleolar RNA-associated 25 [Lasallia pustulata]|uniref:U3 small nucleolar RNA-associated protein 25 n=1 Tax=Lasallia pustulata TaxID=136370 RepID=A0A5M8PG70_9LECA|nr:MAG: U3 small nucleolar RNA-associated 25 [Lasallia pustulata]
MAPLSRGRDGLRGATTRGRGGRRGRGRGRGGFAARGGNKPAFQSTRIEEHIKDDSDGSRESEEADQEEAVDEAPEDVSSDDENHSKSAVKPYNALLQSLNANVQRGQPQRKKLRVDSNTNGKLATVVSNGSRTEHVAPGDLDEVQEPEEGGNFGLEGIDAAEGVDDDDEIDDPFEKHFASPNEIRLSQCIQEIKMERWGTEVGLIERLWHRKIKQPSTQTLYPVILADMNITKGLQSMNLKHKLRAPAAKVFPAMDPLMNTLASSLSSYQDLLFCNRSPQNAKDLQKLTCLHALNHIFKTRDRVIKNNARLAKEKGEEELELRDQGFTRPKVLMLLPTRQSCVRMVDTITSLCEPEQQENRKRFQDAYIQTDDHFSDDKPEDFRELFGGNDDDMFRLDIIFASPLGLRMAIGAEDAKNHDHDFLSSIEIVVLDQADALLMQNWEHVEYILEHLNLQPKEAHGCDFSRVRTWYLDDNAKYLRQTIVFSAFITPELKKIFNRNMLNVSGSAEYTSDCAGAMLDLGVQLKQRFSRFESSSPAADPEARFKYFTTTVVPSLTKYASTVSAGGQGALIFIPSYLDFVRVRNYMSTSSTMQNISFASISEYTPVRDVARARSHFFSGRHSVLLYTERAHHFRRYHLRGVKKVVFYGLPENPIFYKELVGGYVGVSIGEGKLDPSEASVRSVFSKWDRLKLERIVGTTRWAEMLNSRGGDTFDFI